MKVICIDENWQPTNACKNTPSPFVGEICNVIETLIQLRHGLDYYRLGGRFKADEYFAVCKFAPLSNIDETELLNKEFLSCPTL